MSVQIITADATQVGHQMPDARPSQGKRNQVFLSMIDSRSNGAILAAIASHYGITPEEASTEVTDADAEHLLDYLVEPQRSAASALMKKHGLRD